MILCFMERTAGLSYYGGWMHEWIQAWLLPGASELLPRLRTPSPVLRLPDVPGLRHVPTPTQGEDPRDRGRPPDPGAVGWVGHVTLDKTDPPTDEDWIMFLLTHPRFLDKPLSQAQLAEGLGISRHTVNLKIGRVKYCLAQALAGATLLMKQDPKGRGPSRIRTEFANSVPGVAGTLREGGRRRGFRRRPRPQSPLKESP